MAFDEPFLAGDNLGGRLAPLLHVRRQRHALQLSRLPRIHCAQVDAAQSDAARRHGGGQEGSVRFIVHSHRCAGCADTARLPAQQKKSSGSAQNRFDALLNA